MKLGTYVAAAVKKLGEKGVGAGKTNVQKLIYFSLPEEERGSYYYPYRYGPYSGLVQQAIGSLLNMRILDYEGTRLSMKQRWDLPRERDPIIDRLEIASSFLSNRKLTATDQIATLAKIHLLSRTQREDAKRDLPGHIQSQARFLGWRELAGTDRETISTYLGLAQQLENELNSASYSA